MELRRAECARPGSDRDRTRAGGVRSAGKSGVIHCHERCGEGILDKGIGLVRFLDAHETERIESFQLTCYAAGKGRGIEPREQADSGPTLHERLPRCLHVEAERRDRAYSRDDDPELHC